MERKKKENNTVISERDIKIETGLRDIIQFEKKHSIDQLSLSFVGWLYQSKKIDRV